MTGTGEVPSDALEDIAYLARSENRVKVLEALSMRAFPRRELGERTETSRTTLGRILNEFEDRGWAERTPDGNYVATSAGEHLAAQFGPLVGSVETLRMFEDVIGLVPVDELAIGPSSGVTIGLHHFSDASVRRPEGNQPLNVSSYLTELVREATTFSSLCFVAAPKSMNDALREGIRSGRLTHEGVYAGGLVDHLREHPAKGPLPEDLEANNLRLYRYREHIPCQLFVFDETVVIENSQADGIESGTFLETRNETVRAWALEVIDRYIEESEIVHPEDFSA